MTEPTVHQLPAGGDDRIDLGGEVDADEVDLDAAASTPDGGSLLDQLRADLAKELTREPLVLQHRRREAYAMRYSTDLTADQLQALRRRATYKRGPERGQVNEPLVARMLLAQQNTGILRDGVLVADDSAGGRPLRFATRTMLQLTGTSTGAEAVGHFYADDGLVAAHASAVLEAAGFDGEGAEVADPTGEPSID